ncbi:tetratricopeptide repeat protein [Pararhizobium mangrovi]|uniref:Tetratricopeptide repeat protein n=1 Tax=Pararhizobium mangrovi TaxID=2590452 RepID=A0A506U1A0_9HYPH|nr:tetratricopeptide repeat protein [Pararhizobium mangrovi]TPW28133.1 tetratricopeptide repeat protein [Pararhizobium mangrovi]
MTRSYLRPVLARASLMALAGTLAFLPAVEGHAKGEKDAGFSAAHVDSFAGAFLAGRIADADDDADSAIAFYRRALDFDPGDRQIQQRLMIALFTDGRFADGMKLADTLKDDSDVDRVTTIARGVAAMRDKRFGEAAKILQYNGDNDLDRLMNGLLIAWAQYGEGNTDSALKRIDAIDGPEWFAIFKNYSAGLMDEAAGRIGDARKRLRAAITDKTGASTAPDTFMRAVIALAQMEAHQGNKTAARDAVATGERLSPGYPPLDAVRQAIDKGTVGERSVKTANQGAATVLFSVGSALSGQGADEVVALYLRFSQALDPDNPATRVMLGGLAEQQGQTEKAITIYEGIPANSPMRRLSELQRGLDLARLDRTQDAVKQLKQLIAEDPSDMRAYLALGSVYSSAENYQAMADLYDQAVKALGSVPDKANWDIYYQRGIAYERLKQWDKAEPSFKKALDLSPDQPQVLNYLGYSWIDRNTHLEDGLEMVKKAVSLRPNDGYIVDSLGWAYYKLGRFDKAVDELEHAVELKPEDATINAHLGDAYWQAGRRIEARYQWQHAITFGAEKDEVAELKEKLQSGLPAPVDGRPVSAESEKPAKTPDAPAKSGEDRKSGLLLPDARHRYAAALFERPGASGRPDRS